MDLSAAPDKSLTICVQFPIEQGAVYETTMERLHALAARLRVHLGPWAHVEDIGTDNVKIRAEVYVVCRSKEFLGPCRDICLRVLQDVGVADPRSMVEVFGPIEPVLVLPVTAQDRNAMTLRTVQQVLQTITSILLGVAIEHSGHPEKWILEAERRLRQYRIKRKDLLPARFIALQIPHARADGKLSLYQVVRENPEYFPTFHDREKRRQSI